MKRSLREAVHDGLLFGTTCCIYGITFAFFQSHAPEPYMDEVFHLPQTQRYCAGDFGTWDAKITTFPGLYILGAAYAQILALLVPGKRLNGSEALGSICSISVLRSFNVLMALATLALSYEYLRTVQLASRRHAFMKAVTINLLPVHFFTSFLYYTDSGSTFFVVLMYYLSQLSLQRFRHRLPYKNLLALSALNNIIWVLFAAGVHVSTVGNISGGQSPVLWHRAPLKEKVKDNRQGGQGVDTVPFLFRFITKNLPWILSTYLPFIALLVVFLAFLALNGSVVVGDKAHHSMVFHFAQLPYFILVCSSMLAMDFLRLGLWKELGRFFVSTLRSPKRGLLTCLGLGLLWFLLSKFSLVHPFMLADNRHYVFYIWKNFFRRSEYAKFALIPLYIQGYRILSYRLGRRPGLLWRLIFTLALSIVLLPTHLVEFRYFIVPFFLYHLSSDVGSAYKYLPALGLYSFANLFTILVYNLRPFSWNDGSVARFMW